MITERNISITKAMEKQYIKISHIHPEIPSVDFNDIDSLKAYIAVYRARIHPIFQNEETEINSLVDESPQTSNGTPTSKGSFCKALGYELVIDDAMQTGCCSGYRNDDPSSRRGVFADFSEK